MQFKEQVADAVSVIPDPMDVDGHLEIIQKALRSASLRCFGAARGERPRKH